MLEACKPEDPCTGALFIAYYALFIGPAWGLLSGLLGAVAGLLLRSRSGYGLVMLLLASPVFVLGFVSWAGMAIALGLTGLTYVAAVRWMSPLDSARPATRTMASSESLESVYLQSDDPIEQSGFHGGRERWVAERSPIIEAIHRAGDFLDVGCANGLLAADVVDWAADRGFELTPHGIDLGPRLTELARERMPEYARNFRVADAWSWHPDRQWTFVYSLLDLSPEELVCEWIGRLFSWVEPGGRLIVGSYGSKSRGEPPVDVASVFAHCGLEVTGSSFGGEGSITRFAWANKE